MDEAMDEVSDGRAARPATLGLAEAFRLQVAPGVANLAVFLPVAFWLQDVGLPVIFALGAGILLGEVPVTWWIILRRTAAETGRFSFREAFPWARALSWRVGVLLGVPLVLVSVAMMMGGQMVISPAVKDALFPFVPAWLEMQMSPDQMMAIDRDVLIAMWAMSLIVFTGIGGMTQELYARGFLLPRMAHWGWGAPILGAIFFAVLHLAGPWGWPVFFATSLLWSVAVFAFRSMWIGIIGHVGMLFVQSMMFTVLIFAG